MESRVHVDHAINFLGSNWLVLIDAYSKYSCIHPTTSTSIKATTELLEQDTPLCLTMLHHSPLKNSKVGAMREALPTSQGHHTILPPIVLPNVWFIHLSRHSQLKSSLPHRAALQEFLIQYCRTPSCDGNSPSELLNGRQLRTKTDILLPSPAHAAQGKQAMEATKSQAQEEGGSHILCWDTMLCTLLWSQAGEGPKVGILSLHRGHPQEKISYSQPWVYPGFCSTIPGWVLFDDPRLITTKSSAKSTGLS